MARGWRYSLARCLAACLVGTALVLPETPPGTGAASNRLAAGVSSVSMLVEPDAGSRPVVRLIDAARTRVFVAAYILSDHSIVHALERAAAQNVDVYVMLDPHPFGLGRQPQSMADLLRAAGIHVRWSRPGFIFSHEKYMVLDDRAAVIGTANFSAAAFASNREFIVIDRRRPDTYSASALFRADWDRSRINISDPELVVAPRGAREQMQSLIRRAKSSIDVYAEEVADTGVERELGQMARKNVTVRVLLPPSARKAGVAALLRNGVLVRTLSRPYVHAKAVIVDDHEAFVGSENISTTSLDRNRELGLLIRGRPLHVVGSYFARDWRIARPAA